MATAQFSGQYGKNMSLELKAEVTGQNIAGNYSSVHVTAYLHTNGYASLWGVSADATITINGGGAIEHPAINIGTNSTQQIWDHTYDVGHNDDGYKTVGVMLSVAINAGGYGSSMVAFDLPLPTIPRASSGSVTSGDLGTPVNISIDRKVSTFKHTLRYDWNGVTGTIASNVDTSYNWTLPLDFASAIPNATSSWGRVFIDTYNGSTKIGTTEATFTGNVPASIKPTLSSVTLADTNTAVKNLLNTANTFVQVLSNVQVTFNGASGAYGSTISSYRAEILGKNQNTNSNNGLLGMMNYNGAVTIRATVTDSRGRTSDPVDVQATVLEYFTPQLSFSAQRSGSGNTTITVMRNAKIAPLVVGGNQKNTMKLTFKYKEHSATSFTTDTGSAGGTWTTLSNLTNSSANLGATFSVLKSYDIIGTIEDSFTSYDFLAPTVGTESFPLALKVDRMGLGKLPEQAGIVDSAWQYYYNNKPIQHYQLTSNDGRSPYNASGTVNLNAKTVNSFFSCNEPINGPIVGTGLNQFYVSVYSESDNYLAQQAIQKGSGRMFTRTRDKGTWSNWIEYALLNSVAEFTAVNQTKVYIKIIPLPWSGTGTLTRIGNQVQISWNRAISNINTQCEYSNMNETIPSGYRPACEVHMGINGNVSNAVNAWAILHLQTDGSIKLTNTFTGNHVWTGTTTYLTTDPFPSD
uniref:Capsid and scaffold protein n=1 Tax=Siphoviridae sp. ct5TL29 TaxID=2825336 RepID=A0A8S5PFC5_9CAUD|nr:MAG TPA: protein of unknown function DUF859 [Siphoviridae sp. ct5TL29]